jgi:two-component system NtrC family sensor kinase
MPHRSIRAKLTIGALIPFFVALIACSLTGLYLIGSRIARQAQDKVRTDLNSAQEAYQNELSHMGELLQFTAATPTTAAALSRVDRPAIRELLQPLKERRRLDFLTVVDRRGRVVYRLHNPARSGDDLSGRRAVALALNGQPVSGTEVLTPPELQAEGEPLTQQAEIAAVATPRARPRSAETERSGMVLSAAAPVTDSSGATVGALYGGVLLNNNNTLVDKIKETVYEGVKFKGKDVGTATIFLGDLRIATNVQTTDGRRAIGTRLSAEVYRRVFQERQKWVGRAFVVNDWYFSAYEPIFDLSGSVAGSLYVGMLEKPYAEMKQEVSLIFGGVLLVCTIIGLAISGLIGAQLSRPIKALAAFAKRVAHGERHLQVEVRTGDELEELAGEFNEMTRALSQREDEIQSLNRGLEQKVLERTAQLEEKNLLLLKAQADLARAEKLADLGTLAAGVAHEINNPLAIIRGNTEVLEMSIPPEHPNRDEIQVIARQTERMAKIVSSLLDFSHQEQLHQGSVAIRPLLDEVIGQVEYQVPLTNIRIERAYAADLDCIRGDGDQLRQVFVNLIINAIQAMPNGGVLTLATGLAGGSGQIRVTDSGCGIPPANIEKIFTPFFTTKQGGTGLGLSVSYGIIKDHGGEIAVESVVDQGTTFLVNLPLD